ncbi:MAG: hypothetical protein H6999_08245 [Hahellaceae bacterium]|nr:hypothetical protein [Hahellaceae bacterium]MCP5169734.1 hypothetical protein [Hahellaceae bacterium]
MRFVKRWTCILFASISLLSSLTLADSPAVRSGAGHRYLIIHSYSQDLVWVKEISAAIRESMDPGAQFTECFMDTKRLTPEAHQQQARHALKVFFQEAPDLVFLVDDNALRLLGPTTSRSTPTIFGGINGSLKQDYPWVFNSSITAGVLERPLLKRSIIQIQSALGMEGTRTLLILGVSPTAQGFFLEDLNGEDHFTLINGSKADVVRKGKWSEWQALLISARSKGYGMVLMAGNMALMDDEGNTVPQETVVRWTHDHTDLPVFTVHEQQTGPGLLAGGMKLSPRLMGKDMAELALKMIDTNSQHMTLKDKYVEEANGKLIFSRSELARLKLQVRPEFENRIDWSE